MNSIDDARARLPLPVLMEQEGDLSAGARGSIICRFCGDRPHSDGKRGKGKSATLRQVKGRWWFKCFETHCPSGTAGNRAAWDEVAYLSFKMGLPRTEAFKAFLKKAGVWEEREPRKGAEGAADNGSASQLSHGSTESRATVEGAVEAVEDAPQTLGMEEMKMVVDGMLLADGERSQQALKAQRVFWERAPLMESDVESLKVKRGFPPSWSKKMGYRSSRPSNQPLLIEMNEEFSSETLIDAGLFEDHESGPRPNAQWCGWGRTNEKDDKGEWIWGQTFPVIIPYFDAAGTLTGLRPHKGGIRGVPPQLYVPRLPGGPPGKKPSSVIITEGEFKVAALAAVLGPAVGVAAIPCISMAKNARLMEELERFLSEECCPRKIVIAFDNEDKGTKGLPGYKAMERDRYDTDAWAWYLAIVLGRKFCGQNGVRVLRLPDSWRVNGKCDWDGRLAQLWNS